MKPVLLAAFALTAPFALLAGCSNAQQDQTEAAKASGELVVGGGRLVLPAVSGNPAAAYFTLTNGTKDTVSLAAVSVEGAIKSEMHQTSGTSMAPITALNMGAGSSVVFEPGGKHVMVFSLGKSRKAGDSVKLTLTFAGGKTVTAPLVIEAAGGMDHAH